MRAPTLPAYAVAHVVQLAEQIERAHTREEALAIFEEFRFTPAAMMLSHDGLVTVMELVARKVKAKLA